MERFFSVVFQFALLAVSGLAQRSGKAQGIGNICLLGRMLWTQHSTGGYFVLRLPGRLAGQVNSQPMLYQGWYQRIAGLERLEKWLFGFH